MTTTNAKTLNKADLQQFTGTEQWYRHSLIQKILYTDGARYVAQAGGAYWLLDEIALNQIDNADVAAEDFQVWTLRAKVDRSATLACEDGNKNQVFDKRIDFTDFPLNEITLWFSDNVILLPSEW